MYENNKFKNNKMEKIQSDFSSHVFLVQEYDYFFPFRYS